MGEFHQVHGRFGAAKVQFLPRDRSIKPSTLLLHHLVRQGILLMTASTVVCWTKKFARLRQHILKRKEKADVFPCFFLRGETTAKTTSFENTGESHYALPSSNSSHGIFLPCSNANSVGLFVQTSPSSSPSLLASMQS